MDSLLGMASFPSESNIYSKFSLVFPYIHVNVVVGCIEFELISFAMKLVEHQNWYPALPNFLSYTFNVCR